MRRTILVLLLLATICSYGVAQAQGKRRVALVIGNGAYLHASPLVNPPNDARAMADALRGLGFQVLAHTDLDKDGLERALLQFEMLLNGADVGVFFYAGHGLQINGRNYLAPVDAAVRNEASVDFELIDLNLVFRQLERNVSTALIFLDACRNNPLAEQLSRSMGVTRSAAIGRGLARVKTRMGTLIAFATEPDNVALDGLAESANSPFTTALLKYINGSGLEVRQMLTRVRADVVRETNGKQVPWDNSSLLADFYFTVGAPTAPVAPSAPPQTSQPEPSSRHEALFWESVRESTNPAELQAYLDTFPNGTFVALARGRLAALSPPVPRVAAPQVKSEPGRVRDDRYPPAYAHIRGPSFSCRGPLNPVETLLCDDAGLAQADGVMGALYAELGKRLSRSSRGKLRDTQRAWVRQRDQACPVTAADLKHLERRRQQVQCLLAVLDQRLAELVDMPTRVRRGHPRKARKRESDDRD